MEEIFFSVTLNFLRTTLSYIQETTGVSLEAGGIKFLGNVGSSANYTGIRFHARNQQKTVAC
jgi:hypothetical protein